MKAHWMVTLLLIASLSIMAGCSKKEEPAKTPVEPADQETTGMMDTMKQAAAEKAEQVADVAKDAAESVKESFTMDIDLDKTVSDLKVEAAKMDIESLAAVARKYRDAVAEKQNALKPLMDKLAAIPVAEKMGDEAKTLTADIQKLNNAITPLKERLAVYVEAIMDKGGDVKSLMQ